MSSTTIVGNDLETERRRLIHNEVSKKLQLHTIDIEDEVVVHVKIRINADSRITVVEVNSLDKEIRGYIKRSLNNKKISVGAQDELQVLTIPLRFRPQ